MKLRLASCLIVAATAFAVFARAEDVKQIDVSADQSLEWYQEQQMYVARGNAKVVRGDQVLEADLVSAHTRGKTDPNASASADATKTKSTENGDIDKLTAEGNVRITDPQHRILGDHAVYDMTKHTAVVTGDHLRYESEKQIVTAKDSLEYYDDTKMAVARGNAKADQPGRHVEGDILTAEFRDAPTGGSELSRMTADGHVTVVTKTDTVRGNRAVYDHARNIAIVTGGVSITRANGTQLTGDVAEVDFNSNQSRLLNNGHGRVRALLPMSSNKSEPTNPAQTGLP